jgi:hypothetical protein
MYASSAIRFSIKIGIERADKDAPHSRVIRICVVAAIGSSVDYGALGDALPRGVVSKGILRHRADLHAESCVVICEIGSVASRSAIGLVVDAFLSQRIAVTVIHERALGDAL